MGDAPRQSVWRILGTSVRGATHRRTGLPNQDAIAWLPAAGLGVPLILAVSDGHGNARHFRSHIGARCAVEVATIQAQRFLTGCAELAHPSAIKRLAEERLPHSLVQAWQQAVTAHVQAHPFTEQEWALLLATEGLAVRQAVTANPLLAYGATLLIALVTDTFLLCLQLGDGDVLTVADTGDVTRLWPLDERPLANETASLCLHHAWHEVRVAFQVLVGAPPALVLLATDGYANSFRDEAGFRQVGSDLLTMLRTDGVESVYAGLDLWLSEASQAGSGDDITLGILCRLDALPQGDETSATTDTRGDMAVDE